MIGYRYRKPPNASDSFIIKETINNLMQNECTASIIMNEYLYEFISNDTPNPDREVTYTEANIFKQLSSALTHYIIKNKEKPYLASHLVSTIFSIDSKSRVIYYATNSDFEKIIKEIAKKENFNAYTK